MNEQIFDGSECFPVGFEEVPPLMKQWGIQDMLIKWKTEGESYGVHYHDFDELKAVVNIMGEGGIEVSFWVNT